MDTNCYDWNNDYNSDNYQHYAYAEFQTTKGGLSARLSAGVTFLGAENDDESYSRCLFSPVVSFMYRISQSQYFGLKYKLSSEAPTSSDLSKNASLKLPNVVSKGTPGLKSSTEHIVALIYNFSSRYVDVSVMPACYFDKNSIATGFEQDEKKPGIGVENLVSNTWNKKINSIPTAADNKDNGGDLDIPTFLRNKR